MYANTSDIIEIIFDTPEWINVIGQATGGFSREGKGKVIFEPFHIDEPIEIPPIFRRLPLLIYGINRCVSHHLVEQFMHNRINSIIAL